MVKATNWINGFSVLPRYHDGVATENSLPQSIDTICSVQYLFVIIAHNPLVFTDVLKTNCPQEANCITMGLNVVVNKGAISWAQVSYQ